MFGLFESKPIHFRKRVSVISRNQRSLYKLVQNILQCSYVVVPGGPAYRVIDVDDSQGSRSAVAKGKKMVDGVYFDLVIIENEGFRPICAFRMDPKGHEPEDNWEEETKELMAAARSADFPVFVVPILQAYDTFSIVAKLRAVIPEECLIDKQREYMEDKLAKDRQAALDAESVDFKNDTWMDGGGGKIR